MDYVETSLALGIDSVVLAICWSVYNYKKFARDSVKDAALLEVNEELTKYVASQPRQRIPYCVIRGTVLPIGQPLHSFHSSSITGVIQKLTMKQHLVSRGSAGLWIDQERTIHNANNIIPFYIANNDSKVEVLDALAANELDLEIIADKFEPSVTSLGDRLWGFLSGVQQRGFQSKEEMLRDGSIMTGVGELLLVNSSQLQLQPPSDGTPYYLTSMPISSLSRKLEGDVKLWRSLVVFFGSLGVVIVCLIGHRWWRNRNQRLALLEVQRQLEATRKTRRRNVRQTGLSETQLCVVCVENPKEIILLPCGHVCLCEDCSVEITTHCPVCRSVIVTRAAAYLT